MTIAVRSFAKINLGLYIGGARADGYHDLRTVYQTIALHDVIRVSIERGVGRKSGRGPGIELVCKDPRVPLDSSNTCYRMAERVLDELGAQSRVRIEIEKRLPVQGGLGGASSNAVATMIALELALGKTRAIKKKLSGATRLRIAAEVGSDLPLFLIGGTALGVGRGEEVYPLPDLPSVAMVVVTPEIGVSTPKAFADWDALVEGDRAAELRSAWTGEGARPHTSNDAEVRSAGRTNASAPTRAGTGRSPVTTQAHGTTQAYGSSRAHVAELCPAGQPGAAVPALDRLTGAGGSDRLFEVGCALSAWLTDSNNSGYPNTGASAKGGSRVEKLLLDLVRTGIENDFERVVFPQYPELRDIKGALKRAGSRYASLSGSGSTLYGLFRSPAEAAKAASRLRKQGVKAVATSTLTRQKYWKSLVVSG
jgi:4-diphosphocytidyl-2-C-methyl-D-erythritol kinase